MPPNNQSPTQSSHDDASSTDLESVSTQNFKGGATLSHMRIQKPVSYQFTCFNEDDMKALYASSKPTSRRELMKQKRREEEHSKKDRTPKKEKSSKRNVDHTPSPRNGNTHPFTANSEAQQLQGYSMNDHYAYQSQYQPHHTFPPRRPSYSEESTPPNHHPPEHHRVHSRKRSYDYTFLQDQSYAPPQMYGPDAAYLNQRSKSVPNIKEDAPSANGNYNLNKDYAHGAHPRTLEPHTTYTFENYTFGSSQSPGGPQYPPQHYHTQPVQSQYDRRLRRRLSLTEECDPSDDNSSLYSERRFSADFHGMPPSSHIMRRSSMPAVHATPHQHDQRRSSVSSLLGPELHSISIDGSRSHDKSHEEWIKTYKRHEPVDESLQSDLENFKFGTQGSPSPPESSGEDEGTPNESLKQYSFPPKEGADPALSRRRHSAIPVVNGAESPQRLPSINELLNK